jgi:hypothetical protein
MRLRRRAPIPVRCAVSSATMPIAACGGPAGSRKPASGCAVPRVTVGRRASAGERAASAELPRYSQTSCTEIGHDAIDQALN